MQFEFMDCRGLRPRNDGRVHGERSEAIHPVQAHGLPRFTRNDAKLLRPRNDESGRSVPRLVARRRRVQRRDAEEAGAGRAAADFFFGRFAHRFHLQ